MKPKFALILAVLAVPVSAAAEPPSNDEPASALAIDTLPYEHVGDHLEATWSEAEPVPCWDPTRDQGHRSLSLYGDVQTLWYRYTAQEQIVLSPEAYRHNEIDYGGSVDLGVYVESPEGLELLGCSDGGTEDWSEPLPFLAQPGRTYLFVVGIDASPGTRLASFYLYELDAMDVAARSLSVSPLAHHLPHDIAVASSFEATLELGLESALPADDSGAWIQWTLLLCPRPADGSPERCNAVGSGTDRLQEQPLVITEQFTPRGVGDYIVRADVAPIWTLDLQPNDNRREVAISVLIDELGFGVGI